jgi:hypothetical protein
MIQRARREMPSDVLAHGAQLAWDLVTGPQPSRDPSLARFLSDEYLLVAGEGDALAWDVLGAVAADAGDFAHARAYASRAGELAARAGNVTEAQAIAGRVSEYSAGRPFRGRAHAPVDELSRASLRARIRAALAKR